MAGEEATIRASVIGMQRRGGSRRSHRGARFTCSLTATSANARMDEAKADAEPPGGVLKLFSAAAVSRPSGHEQIRGWSTEPCTAGEDTSAEPGARRHKGDKAWQSFGGEMHTSKRHQFKNGDDRY
jgi:hypothetical protein